jgi:uncharacterized membrane protein YhaH (DUF805 family)
LLITGALTLVGSFLLNPTAYIGEDVGHATVPDTIWQLLMVIPLTALTVKRFNDRNWPWWSGYVPNFFGAIVIVANLFGYLMEPNRVGMIEKAFFWSMFFVVLLAFADNAFLHTTGPNRYGPDPLQEQEQTAI